jgi:serine/threonine protein kinase
MSTIDWIGKNLSGRYLIEELIGQGGMSAVFKANDPNLKRIVAVKMIHAHLSSDPGFVSRFEEEAVAIAQLRHPNIVQVFDFNNEEDTYYMVMEFIPGETLQEHLKRLNQAGRTMELEDVVDYMASICEASDYAHDRGMIHRDIKPANIMLSVHQQTILMDFGVAKIVGGQHHTATGAVIGTAQYMSPEQIIGEQLDRPSDIYSLGVTLFEMVSGHPPFESDSAMTLMMMHINDPVPDLQEVNPNVTPAMVAVVNKALSKDKENRYQTAGEMAAALKGILGKPVEVPPMVPPIPTGATIVEEPLPSIEEHVATEIQSPVATTAEAALVMEALESESQLTVEESQIPPEPPASSEESAGLPLIGNIKPLYLFIGGVVILIGLVAIIFGGPIISNLISGSGGDGLPAVAISLTQEIDQVIVLSTQAPGITPAPVTTTITLTMLRTITPAYGSAPTETESVVPEEPQLVLWDLSHGPRQSETGFSYDLDGMYSQLNFFLEENNIILVPNLDSLEDADLDRYSTIVIAMPSAIRQNYTSTEAQIIGQFINRGGSLLILAEAPGFTNRINEVAGYFNIDVGQRVISGSALRLEDHPIFRNVDEVSFIFDGGSLNVRNAQAQVVASQNDLDAVVVIEDLPGKVVAIGDSNLFDNRGISNNQQFALNLFRWLH